MTVSAEGWPLVTCTSPATLKGGIKPARSGYSVGLYSTVPQAWSNRTLARASSFVRILFSLGLNSTHINREFYAGWRPFSVGSLTASLGFELFQLQMGTLHEVPPLLDVGVEEFYEVHLVVLEKRDTDLRQIRARLGLLEHGLDVACDTRSELGRNGDGSEEALPQRRLVLRQSLLGDGRHVRRGGVALLARDSERPRPPRICERQANGHAGKIIGHAPRNHVLHGRRSAFVWNMDRGDSGHHVEKLPAQVIGVAHSGGGEGQLARLGLRARDQLLYAPRRKIRAHDQDMRRRGHRRERHQVPLGAVRQIRNRGSADREAVLRKKQGVAVPRRFSRGLGGDVACRAAAVLHDDGLPPMRAQAVRHHAPDDVGRASRRIPDQQAHGPGRVLLRDCRQRKRESEKRDDAANLHGRLLHRCANIFFPGTGISAVTISPFSESVMWSTLRFAPP